MERNPVRAKIVQKAEEYLYSSAAAHFGLKSDSLLFNWSDMNRLIFDKDWSKWLSISDKENDMTILRRNVVRHKG